MYKTSAELKREAKDALSGRWKDAVLLNIVPSILQIIGLIGMTLVLIMTVFIVIFFISNFDGINPLVSVGGDVYDNGFMIESSRGLGLEQFAAANDINPGSYLLSTGISIIVGFISLSILFTYLDVLRDPMRKIRPGNDAFRLFNGKDFVPVLLIQLITYLFTFLWTLLFIIPGIVKGYAYSQASFIYKDLSEHEETEKLSAYNYVKESNMLMKGHKGRLFYIELSFIGWYILSILTLGIGFLFLNPYMSATRAAFYRNLSQDRYLYIAGETEIIGEEKTDEAEWTNF